MHIRAQYSVLCSLITRTDISSPIGSPFFCTICSGYALCPALHTAGNAICNLHSDKSLAVKAIKLARSQLCFSFCSPITSAPHVISVTIHSIHANLHTYLLYYSQSTFIYAALNSPFTHQKTSTLNSPLAHQQIHTFRSRSIPGAEQNSKSTREPGHCTTMGNSHVLCTRTSVAL
jgi:hypothetical protein